MPIFSHPDGPVLGGRPRLAAGLAVVTLALAAAGTSGAGYEPKQETDCLRHLQGIDLQTATVLDLQAAMDSRALRSTELTARSLQRIAAFDTELNAVRALAQDAQGQAAAMDAERRAGGPRSLLHGVTVLLKDNIGTSDLPTTAGSIALEGHVPTVDATLTSRLRAAGAVVLGKTNLSEFANWVSLSMPNGYSSLGGQVVSPYRFGKDPSGSSTGSAVASAMAFATVAIGTETSGSIISPAWTNGLAAIKPTHGRVASDGIIPLAPSFDVAGPMGRSIVDVAATLDVIDGNDEDLVAGLSATSLDGVRIGVREQDLEPLVVGTFPDEHALFLDALDVLVGEGAEIVMIREPLPTLATASLLELAAIFNEFKVGLNAYLAAQAPPSGVRSLADVIAFNESHPDRVRYGQNLLELSDLQTGHPLDPASNGSALAAREASRLWIDRVLAEYDVVALAAPNSAQANLAAAAGYPNVVVPSGMDSSNPQGLSLVGTAHGDGLLLSLAHDYEQATQLRVPPTQVNDGLSGCFDDVSPSDAYQVVADPDF